jgi:DNA-binding XRE family transcriptional regulator
VEFRTRPGITACQVRMARAALRWSVEEMARHANVSEKTIRRIEKVYGVPPNVTLDTLERLRSCIEAQGMTLIPEDGSPEGPGLRYGRYPGRVIQLPTPLHAAPPGSQQPSSDGPHAVALPAQRTATGA